MSLIYCTCDGPVFKHHVSLELRQQHLFIVSAEFIVSSISLYCISPNASFVNAPVLCLNIKSYLIR